MNILYATHNKGKIEAMKRIIRMHNLEVDLCTPNEIGFNEDIIEDGKTFEENSEIKARAIREFCEKNGIGNRIIIADDAGMCVDALDGAPGVLSARYAGENGTQEQILSKLLKNMEEYPNPEDRKCKFVCVLTAILPDGEKIVTRGECKGILASEVKEYGGLTYTPVFIPNGFNKPMLELNDEEMLKVHNHRDLAMNEMINIFKEKEIE